MTMLSKEEVEDKIELILDSDTGSDCTVLIDELLAHDQAQRAVIGEQQKELEWFKERDEVAKWYETLVTRPKIGTKDTPSLKAYIEQVEAKIEQQAKEIDSLRSELNEVFVDERETAWTRPTAWAYAQVCKALDKKVKEITELREALRIGFNRQLFERPPCYICGYNGQLYYQPGMHPCAQFYHQHALKEVPG